jgi:hypothetical protein
VSRFARSVNDLDRGAEAFGLPSNPDGLGTLRIDVFRGPHWEEASADARDLLDGAVNRLAGADVSSCSIEFEQFGGLTAAQETIIYGEGTASFRPEARRFGDRLHPLLRDIADNVKGVGPEAMRNAYDLVARCGFAFEARLQETCDAVLTSRRPARRLTPLTAPATPGSIKCGRCSARRASRFLSGAVGTACQSAYSLSARASRTGVFL